MLGAGATHGQFIAAVFFHLLAVIENQVNGFGDFGDGLEAILPNFKAEQRGEFELTLHHQVGGFAQERDTFLPAKVSPGGINRPGRLDGLACVVAIAELKFAEHQTGVGR